MGGGRGGKNYSGETLMKPFINQVSFITLGVDNLERAVAFYRDVLGWKTNGIVGSDKPNGAVAFFQLQAGLMLALWPRESIAAEHHLPIGPADPASMMLALNVATAGEVDQMHSYLSERGAVIHRPPAPFSWGGYGTVFADPDGHLWEIVWNPQFSVAAC